MAGTILSFGGTEKTTGSCRLGACILFYWVFVMEKRVNSRYLQVFETEVGGQERHLGHAIWVET